MRNALGTWAGNLRVLKRVALECAWRAGVTSRALKAYSLDLRRWVLSAALRGDRAIPEVAGLFGVSATFVNKMLRLHRAGADLAPRPHGGGHVPRVGARHHKLLRAAVSANNDATLGELREHLEARAHVRVSDATTSRALSKLGLTRKKSIRAAERNNYKRGLFRRRACSLSPRRFVFVDESAVNTTMTRRYGRVPRGERAHDSAPRNCGTHTLVIGAMGLRGLVAALTIEGAVDAGCFNAYAERVLGPRLRPGDVVVLDNLTAHRASRIEEVAESRGAQVLWLPPYSPDFSPIAAGQRSRVTCARRRRARARS